MNLKMKELPEKVLNIRKNGEQKDLRFLQDVSIEELMEIKGIGKVKAIQILAACELAKRMSKPIHSLKIMIKRAQDEANLFKIWILHFGGTNFARIEPQIILAEPVKMNAPRIILVHNHPSGDARPSDEDFRMTDRIHECADVMGIRLMDHVIIGENGFSSVIQVMREQKEKEMKNKKRKEDRVKK